MKVNIQSCLVLFIVLNFSFLIKAQNEPSPKAFDIDPSNSKWTASGTGFTEIINSKESFGGVDWIAKGFINNSQTRVSNLAFGVNGAPYTPYIQTIAPLPYVITDIVIDIEMAYMKRVAIESISLQLSDDTEFEDIEDIEPLVFEPTSDKTRWTLAIPNPVISKYYRLTFKCEAMTTNYALALRWISFFGYNLTIPVMTPRTDSAKNVYEFVSSTGPLHLIASVYDGKRNHIRDIYSPSESASSSIMRIAAADTEDTNWRNQVADQNIPFTVAPEDDEKLYTKIRAKSIIGNYQTPELETWIHLSGIKTGIEEFIDDANAEDIKWFNLQGESVKNPSNGLFIQVKNGKANKVFLSR